MGDEERRDRQRRDVLIEPLALGDDVDVGIGQRLQQLQRLQDGWLCLQLRREVA